MSVFGILAWHARNGMVEGTCRTIFEEVANGGATNISGVFIENHGWLKNETYEFIRKLLKDIGIQNKLNLPLPSTVNVFLTKIEARTAAAMRSFC